MRWNAFGGRAYVREFEPKLLCERIGAREKEPAGSDLFVDDDEVLSHIVMMGENNYDFAYFHKPSSFVFTLSVKGKRIIAYIRTMALCVCLPYALRDGDVCN